MFTFFEGIDDLWIDMNNLDNIKIDMSDFTTAYVTKERGFFEVSRAKMSWWAMIAITHRDMNEIDKLSDWKLEFLEIQERIINILHIK